MGEWMGGYDDRLRITTGRWMGFRGLLLAWLCLHWLGHLPSLASLARFAYSQGFIECFTED